MTGASRVAAHGDNTHRRVRRVKPLPLNRLCALEKLRAREPPIHLLWVDEGDTDADVEEQRNRLIADGRASADDRFLRIGWR